MGKQIVLGVSLALVASGTTLHAQDVVIQRFAGGEQGAGLAVAAHSDVDIVAFNPLSVGRTATNAPYTAEAVTEVTQVLGDGNRIEQRSTATVARDGKGRTRREQSGIALGSLVAQSGRPLVTILDPRSGTYLMLDYERKVAMRSKPMTMKARATADVPADAPAGAAESGAAAGGVMTSRFTGPVIVAPPIAGAAAGTFEVFQGPPPPPLLPMRRLATLPFAGPGQEETLEPRIIEGLRAEGTRRTMTIPAGAIGNALPIEVLSERWYSPELKVLLMTRRSDPRFGETVYRLTNITREEPAADLFTVPSDFRIEEMRP